MTNQNIENLNNELTKERDKIEAYKQTASKLYQDQLITYEVFKERMDLYKELKRQHIKYNQMIVDFIRDIQ